MDSLDMSKEQIVEWMNSRTNQPNDSVCAEAPEGHVDGNLPTLLSQFGYLSGASQIGLIITDTNGLILSFNKTIQDLLGICISDYINTNVRELYAHPKDREQLLAMLSASGAVHDFEVEVKHKDGTLRTVLANIDFIQLNDDHILLTSIYDITQYKERHQGSGDSFHTLFSNVPVGITVTDYQGNLTVINNAIKEMLGYSSDELKRKSIVDFYFIPADRQQLLDLTKRYGNVRDFETVFKHKNGSSIYVLINTDVIEFNGQKDMLLTSIRDISSLKRVEDELVRERDFSNAILNIAATLIVVLDHNGNITRFNRACEQASGYTFAEMCGTSLWDIRFFDPELPREAIERLLRDNYPNTYQNTVVSKSGEKHVISWTFASMMNSTGNVEYIIATGIDITKKLQAEEKLHNVNKELAFRVKELQQRTEEMDQLNEMGEQLQSCQTIAEACAISVQYVQKICPESRGALYLINNSRDSTEAVEMWGEPSYAQKIFSPMGCWAIRRGRTHLVDPRHPGLRCEHVAGPESGQYLCIPLLVNGEALGILHLNRVAPDNSAPDETPLSYTENRMQIVTTVAEHIALALSNLKLKETLRQQSIRDPLTGLFNRRYMEETFERELNRAERENKPIGVIMFDIDHFKAFNDLAGHDGGDALLRELGALVNKSARGGDIVCRYGGEEFLEILPGIHAEDARQRAEKLRQSVKELLVYHLGKPLATCTISLGVAVFPENGLSCDALLKSADTALYRAKNEGRDRVVMANGSKA